MQHCADVRATYRKQQTPQLWMEGQGRDEDSFALWSYPIWFTLLKLPYFIFSQIYPIWGPQAILEGNHDNPESGTHPNSTTSAWRKTGTANGGVTVPDFPKGNKHQPHAQLHLFVRSFVEREFNGTNYVEISLMHWRERALKGKASDSDEKMMTVERSYHKGALLIQRSVEPVLPSIVSFISIHRTSTFNLQSATKWWDLIKCFGVSTGACIILSAFSSKLILPFIT